MRPLGCGGAAWGEQDNAGVHFLLQKTAKAHRGLQQNLWDAQDVQVFFLGLEKKDHLAELLDVGARCIWMWFALFLNNRQF